MIFVWIGYLWAFVVWLWIPPDRLPKRDVNDECVVCGHRKGKITATTNGGKPSLRHDCLVCHGTWFEDPVLGEPKLIQAGLQTQKE